MLDTIKETKQIAQILELPENRVITALIPVGFPDQSPAPRPRVGVQNIIYRLVE